MPPNLNHIFLVCLLFVLVVAVAHAQQMQIAGFQCDKGICVTSEETVERIQTILNKLVAIIEQQKKEKCT